MHLSPQIPSGIYKLITEIFKEVLASLLDIRPTPEKQLHFYIKKQLFVDAPYKKGNISKLVDALEWLIKQENPG